MKYIRRINPRPVVTAVVVVGLTATALAAAAVTGAARGDADRWMDKHAEVVRDEALDTMSEVIEDLEAVAAFLETAPETDERAFGEFLSRIDGSISQIGVAYASVVSVQDLDEFVATARSLDPGYQITELDPTGELGPAAVEGREAVYPIKYFAPGSYLQLALQAAGIPDSPSVLAAGLDAGSTPDWLPSLQASVERDTAVVSDFIEIAYEGFTIPQVFFVLVPVHDDGGNVTGLVMAPMLDVLLTLSGYTSDEVEWEVNAMGSPTGLTGDLLWSGTIDLPGVAWQLTVVPTEAKAATLHETPVRLVAILGFLTTALLAALIHLALQRRSARLRLEGLQKLSEDKDRFLAAVSHEIRTPLTTVHGLAHELADRPADFSEEEAASLLDLVVEQADEVAAIVEDLLVAARTDIGKVSIYPAEVQLDVEMEEALAGTGADARVLGTSAPAWADPRRVRQILRNLLTNAGRYGGPRLEVRFEVNHEWAKVTVADDGSPISEEHRQRIFDPYTSAHEGNTQVGSVGLGLFISRKLARVMGGDLEYHHDGEFSCFSLRLPRAEDSAPLRAVS